MSYDFSKDKVGKAVAAGLRQGKMQVFYIAILLVISVNFIAITFYCMLINLYNAIPGGQRND